MIESVKRFFEPLQNTRKSAFLLIIFGSVTGVIQIAVVEAFRYATNYLEIGLKEAFTYAMVALFVLECMHLLKQYFFKKVDWYIMYDFKKEVYTKVLRQFMILDHNFADLLGIGRLQSILLKGTDRRASFLFKVLLLGSTILVVTIGSLYVLFKTNIYIGLGSLFSICIVFIIFIIRNKGDRAYRKLAKDGTVEVDKLSVMQMMSKFEIIQSSKLDKELQRYCDKVDLLTGIETARGLYNFLAYRAVFSFFNMVQVATLFVAGYLVFDGVISLSDFFVMVLAFRLLLKMLTDFKSLIRLYSKEFVNIEKIREVFDDGPKLTGVFEGDEFMNTGEGIEMREVSFGYNVSEPIFENFDLKIPGGTKTALVGLSGGGKSTLVKLVAGYLRPNSGSIHVDGQDLTDVSLKSYYRHVGYLTQEPSVFDGTVIENLTYAIDEHVSDQKMKEVISLAKCDFIRDFPKGLDTEIGERGIRLSGGQRQRLAIAKVFLKNPEIIILDEPTSALDSFSEEAITQAMHNLFAGRTVIIIAHRLQTVKHADDIIVLDHGKIVERGTHEILVGVDGSYAKMLELQSGF